MNRNTEAHFSELPTVDVSRSRFDRSSDVKFTGNVGDLIPFYVDEVLPGDTFSVDSSKVVRLQTLLYPMMDNLYMDTYWFFVPNRLVWSHWKNFMGETIDAWRDSGVSYSVPQLKISSGDDLTGSALDYMGVPVQTIKADTHSGTYFYCNALPWRAYQLIFNDWFRDENLQDSILINVGDSDTVYSSSDTLLYKANKLHDYFTSCLPSAQRGDSVPFLVGRLPVVTGSDLVFTDAWDRSATPVSQSDMKGKVPSIYPLVFTPTSSATIAGAILSRSSNNNSPTSSTPYGLQLVPEGYEANSYGPVDALQSIGSANPVKQKSGSSWTNLWDASVSFPVPANLWAYFNSMEGNQIGSARLTNNINSLRFAFQLQKFLERDARGGTRYIEMLKSHFGVTSPDARMQRPEYLGGNRVALNINQVINQSEGDNINGALGNLGAMSHTVDRHSDFTHSFTEHGFLLGLCVVRYDHSYQQGFERMWLRQSRYDYYWPVFANIGEQPVWKQEIFATPGKASYTSTDSYSKQIPGTPSDLSVFGFQEAWADYRYKPSRVAGEMRSGLTNSLDAWHLADYYSGVPSLSSSWIPESKANVDRVLQVSSSLSNQVLFDIYVKNTCTRCMPMYSIPGLIDHH